MTEHEQEDALPGSDQRTETPLPGDEVSDTCETCNEAIDRGVAAAKAGRVSYLGSFASFANEPGPPSIVDAIQSEVPRTEAQLNKQLDEDRLCALWKVVNAATAIVDDARPEDFKDVRVTETLVCLLEKTLAVLRAVPNYATEEDEEWLNAPMGTPVVKAYLDERGEVRAKVSPEAHLMAAAWLFAQALEPSGDRGCCETAYIQGIGQAVSDAAKNIKKLETEIEEARAALKPFADAAEAHGVRKASKDDLHVSLGVPSSAWVQACEVMATHSESTAK